MDFIVCVMHENYNHCEIIVQEIGCSDFKDKSRYIELPCDIGDKVYFIKSLFDYAKQPMCGTVCMIKTFTGRESWTFGAIMDENLRERHFVSNDIGKTVFLTYEEAEKKLKELIN